MTKTIVVDVQRRMQHPRFRKIIKAHKKFKVHVDEDGLVKIGDVVMIIKKRRISKDKHFVLYKGKETAVKEKKAEQKKSEVKAEVQTSAVVSKEVSKPAATKKAAAPKKAVTTKPVAKKTAVKKAK